MPDPTEWTQQDTDDITAMENTCSGDTPNDLYDLLDQIKSETTLAGAQALAATAKGKVRGSGNSLYELAVAIRIRHE